jgi:hypothetical protein
MFAKVYNGRSCFYKIYLIITGTKNIIVKSSIRPDIQYPAFGLTGYPDGRISDKNSIRCIPTIQFVSLTDNFIQQYSTGTGCFRSRVAEPYGKIKQGTRSLERLQTTADILRYCRAHISGRQTPCLTRGSPPIFVM